MIHPQVKKFIEHYVYLLENSQIDMFIYLAVKEFETANRQKLEQLLNILHSININTSDAQKRLFINHFKEAFTRYSHKDIKSIQIPLSLFIFTEMRNRKYGFSLDECAQIILNTKIANISINPHNRSEWLLHI